MSDYTYLAVDLELITKAEYYKVRTNTKASWMVAQTPFGFVTVTPTARTMYLTSGGKFYKGKLRSEQNATDMEIFDFLGIEFRAPQAVFMRKPDNETITEAKVA